MVVCRYVCMYVCMDGWMDGLTEGGRKQELFCGTGRECFVGGWMDRWMDGWIESVF